MMTLSVTATQQSELAAAVAVEPRLRSWRRYQAVLLLAAGQRPAAIAAALRCSVSSVYGWAARWRQDGVSGLGEGPHPGAARRRDAPGTARLEALLAADPQACGHRATGWTAALLRTELAQAGYVVGERTIRRTLHRLGYRGKRPQYVLGRPDPAYAEKRGP